MEAKYVTVSRTLSPRTRGCSAVEVEGADDDAVFSGALRRIHLAAGK